MLLACVAFDVNTPELATHNSLPHSGNICVAQQSLVRIKLVVPDTIVKLYSEQPGQVVVSIDERRRLKNPLRSQGIVGRINWLFSWPEPCEWCGRQS